MKIVKKIKTFLWSVNGIHLVKGTFGFLICLASFSTGLSNKACPLQPQLPIWIFGTSGFLFLANVVSLVFINVPTVISWLENIKKRHQNVGRFLDHVHGFCYSTFLIWVVPGFQWVHKTHKSFEYRSKHCESNVKTLSLLLLFLLCLEVFVHFHYFLFNLFKQFKLKKQVAQDEIETFDMNPLYGGDYDDKESEIVDRNNYYLPAVEYYARVQKKGTQENTGSTNAGLRDSRENLEKGKVSVLSKVFESIDEESQRTAITKPGNTERTTKTKPPVKYLPNSADSFGK